MRNGTASVGNGRVSQKRAEQQVKAIGADEVGPQIGVPVPGDVPGSDGLMGQLIERNLLDVKVPVEEKDPLVVDDKWQKHHRGQRQGDEKRLIMALFFDLLQQNPCPPIFQYCRSVNPFARWDLSKQPCDYCSTKPGFQSSLCPAFFEKRAFRYTGGRFFLFSCMPSPILPFSFPFAPSVLY